jgi:hypothetical protein
MPQEEPLSYKKFFKGFVNAKNTAKAVVTIWHVLVVCAICYGLFLVAQVVMKWVDKPAPTDTSTITGQTVTQNIDKSEKQVSQTYLPFSGGLLSFGSHGKTQSEEN